MSRSYEMYVSVTGFDPKRKEDIENAANLEWNFPDWDHYKGEITATGQSNLCGGETEEEFAKRLQVAIVKANGKPCKVDVTATCLEDLPCDTYNFDEEDCKDIFPKKKGKKK